MKKVAFLLIASLCSIFCVWGQSKDNSSDKLKQKLISKIANGILKAQRLPKLQLYISDIDSVEADVNRLNKIDLETSLKYYPKVNLLREKAENSKSERAKMLADNYKEAGQKEYYTLISILEEDEKLNSFDPKDLIDIADRAFELMSDPANDLVYNERIYFIRGKAYFELFNFYSAILNFKKITNFQKDTITMKYMALSFYNIKKNPEATNYIDKALILNKNDEDLTYAHYLINKQNSHEQGMFADLLELQDADPQNIKYAKLMGDYHYNQQKYLLAWKEYDKISKKDPKNSFAWMLMGNCYLALNEKENALAHFQKAKALGNKYADKIIESLEMGYVFINEEHVRMLNTTGILSKPLMYLNTGFKVRAIDQNDKWTTIVAADVDSIHAVVGYVPTKNIIISLLGMDSKKLNERISYYLPENSPLYTRTDSKVYFKGWKDTCIDYINSKGEKRKINLHCP